MPMASHGHVDHRPEQVEDPEGAVVPAGRRSPSPGPPRPGRTSPGRWPRPGAGAGGRRCSARASTGRTATTRRPPRTPTPRPRPRRAYGTEHFEKSCTRSVRWSRGRVHLGRRGGVRFPTRGASRRRRSLRLPLYYRALLETADQEIGTVSSERLAELAGVNAAKVRKDLSYLGSYGTRGVGYDVEHLLHEISRELGLTHDWPVAIVGVGNLGHALANYRGFGARGYRVVAAGRRRSREGRPDASATSPSSRSTTCPTIARTRGVAIGIIATPAHAAQEVADRLVDAGVTSILNFAPTVVTAPPGVSLRKVDLAIELQILSFYQQRRDSAPPAPDRARNGEAAPRAR